MELPERRLDEVIIALASLARTGWMLRGVPSQLAEPVSTHSFTASLLAFEIASHLTSKGHQLDAYRAAAIAVLHDLGEAIIGDIPKTAGIGEAKRAAEARAVESLPISQAAKGLISEFEEKGSEEAVIARIAELAATWVMGKYYSSIGYNVGEIIESSRRAIRELVEGRSWKKDLEEFLGSRLGLLV